jgi:hypothetical protein
VSDGSGSSTDPGGSTRIRRSLNKVVWMDLSQNAF